MTMTKMPSLPRTGRKVKPLHPCACGCGQGTHSTWYTGHDGRATGWAIRVERGVLTIDDVPANERAGAELMLARRATKRGEVAPPTAAERKAQRKAERAARKAVAAQTNIEPVAGDVEQVA